MRHGSRLQARTSEPGTLATVTASSGAIAEPQQTIEHHTGTADGPTPAVTDSLTWTPGSRPRAQQTLTLGLSDVGALAVDTVSAKLKCATVTATTDGATALTLLRLRPQSAVTENGTTLATAGSEGAATVNLAAGTSTLEMCSDGGG